MERCRFDRHRANCVVGTVVAPHFIDRQKLDELESNVGGPVDELAQNRDVADAKISLTAQTEKRRKNPRDLFLRRQIHADNDECRMSKPEGTTKPKCRYEAFSCFVIFYSLPSPRRVCWEFLSRIAMVAGKRRRSRRSVACADK